MSHAARPTLLRKASFADPQRTCAEMCVRTLETPLTEESLQVALRPTLAAKQYGAEDLLSRLVAEAVMAVMPSNPKTVCPSLPAASSCADEYSQLPCSRTVQRRQRPGGQDHGWRIEPESRHPRNGVWSRAGRYSEVFF